MGSTSPTVMKQLFPYVIGSLFVACCLLLSWHLFVPAHPMTKTKMEQRIRAALPQGCSRQAVQNWLDSQGIDNGVLRHVRKQSDVDEIDDKEITEHSEGQVNPENVGWVVGGNLYDIRRFFLDQYDIRLWFFFDRNNRLIHFVVTEFSMSL